MNVLHGLTGSVATSLYPKINETYNTIRRESKKYLYHLYVSTKNSKSFADLSGANMRTDVDEWEYYRQYKSVLHINLVKWADVFVIAPLSANTLAKIANGICDNLLTCVARAWDFQKPFIVAPAMNTKMWTHPITEEHVKKLRSWGITVLEPIEKTLYCGDTGIGAMANIDDIIRAIKI